MQINKRELAHGKLRSLGALCVTEVQMEQEVFNSFMTNCGHNQTPTIPVNISPNNQKFRTFLKLKFICAIIAIHVYYQSTVIFNITVTLIKMLISCAKKSSNEEYQTNS